MSPMSSSFNETLVPGFDAAVGNREHDHLNRWPFAREIYGIASVLLQ